MTASGDCGAVAAYVLGALPGADRRAFEEHLAACVTCREAVAELAGIPGLLARVTLADLTGPASPGPVPDTLLPRLLRDVRRRGRVRRAAAAGVAAAAVVATVLVIGLVIGLGHDASPGAGGTGTRMTRLVAAPISASVALHAEGRSTRLDMTCRYGGASYGHPPSYHLVVTGTDGRSRDLAQWQIGPDGSTRVVASVDLAPGDIASVEVRSAAGRPVLRLTR